MKKILFNSIIDGVTKKKDGTLSIKLGTQELDAQDTAQIFEFGNQQIYTVFAETGVKFEDLEIPEVVPEFSTDKSPSQRLRNIIYVYWDTKTDKSKDFDTFYKVYVEKIIENIKDKLD